MDSSPSKALLVVGIIGPVGRSLSTPVPEGLTLRRQGRGWAVYTSGPSVEETRRSLCWGRYVIEDRRPRDWSDASIELGLAGFWTTAGQVRLHTDAFALQDVFVRDINDVLYFSNRIAPLRDLGGRLDADEDGWGAAFGFNGFIGATTPFRQIRRLRAGESIVRDRRGIRWERQSASWLDPAPASVGPAEIKLALLDVLPDSRSGFDGALTLSGGWDSRLIALGLHAKQAPPRRVWTVQNDDGTEDDVVIAQELAHQLDFAHTVVPSPAQTWVRYRRDVLARVEHQTWLHTWLEPMARKVRADGLPVLDGLGGDILLRTLLGYPGERDIFDQLTRRRFELVDALQPELADRWLRESRAFMEDSAQAFAGHPIESRLQSMAARTARVVATSPLRLFAPEVPVLLPYLTTSFVRVAAGVPTAVVRDWSFYRSVLAAFNPEAAALRSTNDGKGKTKVRLPLAATPHALDVAAEVIEADPYVLDLLHPRLQAAVLRRERTALRPFREVMQWASTYADWRLVNAAALGQTAKA